MTRLTAAVVLLSIAGMHPAWAQPRATTTVRDCPACPEMVAIRGGAFTMGAPPGEEEQEGVPPNVRGRSQPQRQVIVTAFMLGRFEVTRDEFAEFARVTRQRTDNACWSEGQDGKRYEYKGLNWTKPGFPQTGRDPVVCVNWFEARAYAGWLTKMTGKRYRLPSEAEWEYAARAGSTGARPFPGDRATFCARANIGDLALAEAYKHKREAARTAICSDGYAFTSPVGAFPPNAFGLHDMLGNVWEWTEDCWNPTLDGATPDQKPRYSGECDKRVVRGGGWFNETWRARPAYRFRDSNGHNGNMLGFRLARDP
jgi:formylglycine-generating enzyme required for sulfatase activity